MRRIALGLTALLAVACTDELTEPTSPQPGIGPPGQTAKVDFWLTLLHNNDGESALLGSTEDGFGEVGGVARFATLIEQLKQEARTGPRFAMAGTDGLDAAGSLQLGRAAGRSPWDRDPPVGAKRGVVFVSSGDNFLAGAEFNASLQKGAPYYDGIALDLIGYDALAIGNHDFDFGPDVLADFIGSFTESRPSFVSANLDFSGESELQSLEGAGRIAGSVVIKERGELVGIVGATTELLSFISSPRNVVVNAVAPAVQAEVDRLEASGIDKIIFISHLQSLQEDQQLIGQLSGVDVAVAGGGDELLANLGDPLLPGDASQGPYPTLVTDARGRDVPIVTTSGAYEYVGRLVVGFDKDGEVVAIDDVSGPVRVAAADGLEPNPEIQARVTEPVAASVASLAANVIGTAGDRLNGTRGLVRTTEMNMGSLVADALRWQASKLASSFGVAAPDVALQNGGGIRRSVVIEPGGSITELDAFTVLPFPNFVTVLENIPRDQFKQILENAVSRVEFTDGRFAQVSGFCFVWDPSEQPRLLDGSGNPVQDGSRVRRVVLNDNDCDDGTDAGPVIVDGGAVVAGGALTVATIDFLARGGDQYPYNGANFNSLGVTYQQAFANYIQGQLGGSVAAVAYPEFGEGRIVRLP
jgi:5'-nucleotidase